MMRVSLVNDGPVTILLDSRRTVMHGATAPAPRSQSIAGCGTCARSSFAACLAARRRPRSSAQQRPIVTEDPETIGAGRVLLEGGIEYGSDLEIPIYGLKGDLWRLPSLGVSIGLSSIVEVPDRLRLQSPARHPPRAGAARPDSRLRGRSDRRPSTTSCSRRRVRIVPEADAPAVVRVPDGDEAAECPQPERAGHRHDRRVVRRARRARRSAPCGSSVISGWRSSETRRRRRFRSTTRRSTACRWRAPSRRASTWSRRSRAAGRPTKTRRSRRREPRGRARRAPLHARRACASTRA